ncbi:MAG: putative PEP-binding protein, partial [Candidatus Pacearchaeota archaeon]
GAEQEPRESNPMLGWHGIRRSLDQAEILEAEFKAIKILHEKGYKNVGIMLPFLISVEELKKAKQIMRRLGLEPCKEVDFGVMLETPASCLIIEDLCSEGISFVSFGTNDLTQLVLGVDRNNENLISLYDEMHPAVLKLLELVINVCKKYGVKTSICGQAASNPEMAKWLVKKGIDSLSVNIDAVEKIREIVSSL